MTNLATKRKKQAKRIRDFRKIHRLAGITLFFFFFIVSITGLLLGMKKHSGGVLLARTAKGTTADLTQWLPLNELHHTACVTLQDSLGLDTLPEANRIDVRKSKGIVKFVFDGHYGIQLDGATAAVLSFQRRHSDYIENIHDGSVLDTLFQTEHGQLKLIYSTLMGTALFVFTATGFWLWYGPKQMRTQAKKKSS